MEKECLTEILAEIKLVLLAKGLNDVKDVPKDAKTNQIVGEFDESELPGLLERFGDIELVSSEPAKENQKKKKDAIDFFFLYFIDSIITHVRILNS